MEVAIGEGGMCSFVFPVGPNKGWPISERGASTTRSLGSAQT